MKELKGAAAATVRAPIEECFALLAALDRYPDWYPEVVREVSVLERGEDGLPARAETKLHVSHGPIARDLSLLLAVGVEAPVTIRLTRVPHGASDPERFEVTWRLQERRETHVALELDAKLSVPRLVPLGGIGDAIADGFIQAAICVLAPPS